MNYEELVHRILHRVDELAYVANHEDIDPDQKPYLHAIGEALSEPSRTARELRQMAQGFYDEGRIDKVMLHSALHVIAASPKVQDPQEAARQVALQELAAYEVGGRWLAANLASVDRHRGVLAFNLDQLEIALDYFSRAFERQRIPGNVGNVLATLLRLGEIAEARDLHRQVQSAFPPYFTRELERLIGLDPDLALLRKEDHR